MHDIGKVALADNILLKPGKLTPDEFEIMKSHTIYGGRILEGAHSQVLKIAHKMSLYHHEKWNGSGYPKGLKGEEIPIEARIVTVADVFDALCMFRVYKKRGRRMMPTRIFWKNPANRLTRTLWRRSKNLPSVRKLYNNNPANHEVSAPSPRRSKTKANDLIPGYPAGYFYGLWVAFTQGEIL